MLAKLT
jgi:hypothetical protein